MSVILKEWVDKLAFLDKIKGLFTKSRIKKTIEKPKEKKIKEAVKKTKVEEGEEREIVTPKVTQKYVPLDSFVPYCHKCKRELEGYPFICSICRERFCEKHYLPESHGCMSSGKPGVGMTYGPKGGVRSY